MIEKTVPKSISNGVSGFVTQIAYYDGNAFPIYSSAVRALVCGAGKYALDVCRTHAPRMFRQASIIIRSKFEHMFIKWDVGRPQADISLPSVILQMRSDLPRNRRNELAANFLQPVSGRHVSCLQQRPLAVPSRQTRIEWFIEIKHLKFISCFFH